MENVSWLLKGILCMVIAAAILSIASYQRSQEEIRQLRTENQELQQQLLRSGYLEQKTPRGVEK